MAFEHKENSGTLFSNDDKKSENHPDIKGSAKIDGVDYWVSGWRNQTSDGTKKYLKLSFKRKDEQQGGGGQPGGDGIPFSPVE